MEGRTAEVVQRQNFTMAILWALNLGRRMMMPVGLGRRGVGRERGRSGRIEIESRRVLFFGPRVGPSAMVVWSE
jgi:hypothetical protein